jgi:hypothetical protein
MATSSISGFNLSRGAFDIKAKPNVNTPNRPINIIREIINLLTSDNSPVIPVDNPTVLSAEATSNRRASNLKLLPSKNSTAKVPLNNITA